MNTITSFLGNTGPEHSSGLTPSQIGWGPDDGVYPDRFAVNRADSAEMVWVPCGSFPMGTQTVEIADMQRLERPELTSETAWLADDERPCRRVTVTRGFWLYRHPVSRGQCRALLGECPPHRMAWRRMLGSPPPAPEPDWSNDGLDEHPVAWATWEYARGYAEQTGTALPTEAEWEYAARGSVYRRYPWGGDWDASKCQSIADRHGFEFTAPVGQFPEGRSWCGALDMAGNVFEWCRDWFASYSYEDVQTPELDPECTDSESGRRVLRGGSCLVEPVHLRCSTRWKADPDYTCIHFGFRCAAR